MSQARPLPTQIGRYDIVRLLGLGAMGRVLLGRDPVLDREVAIKLLRDDLGLSEEQRRTLLDRMRQEARAAARVSHPNIVALHDMGDDPDLGLYLVFEYLDGETVKERLLRTPLGAVGVAALSRELGSALTTAHSAGVLHRDIKPENIILTRSGSKIADFGIARVPDSTLTLAGGLLGTPAYSAPEAITEGRFSPQSDQFSLAATLYEALSGERAFPGEDAVAVANRITTERPPPIAHLAGVDTHVDTILSRALSKNPRARFESCEEFGRTLAEAIELAPRSMMATTPDQAHREAPESPPLRLARASAGGAAIGALVTIAAFQLTAHLRSPAPARAATTPAASAGVVPPQAQPPITEAMPVAWLDERPAPEKPAVKRPPRQQRSTEPADDAEPTVVARLDKRRTPDAGVRHALPLPDADAGPKAKP